MMVSNSPTFGAKLLTVAGLYQLTRMKDACLEHCGSPAHCISENWKPGKVGALRMGLEHGAFCLGCCWILMGLLRRRDELALDCGHNPLRPVGENHTTRLLQRLAGVAMTLCGLLLCLHFLS
jgi:hypothetical protein